MKIYTWGYIASSYDDLRAYLRATGALLVDVRLSPYSRLPLWHGDAIQRAVQPCDYIHVAALGNVNYKGGGPIRLRDPEAGYRRIAAMLERTLEPRDIILMCACYDATTCHRKTAAEYLANSFAHLKPEIVHLPNRFSMWQAPEETVKVLGLSLLQPWATLMAIGAKKIETRSWSTQYRGLVAIAASKKFNTEDARQCHQQPFAGALVKAGYRKVKEIPTGAILAVGRLEGCWPTEHIAEYFTDADLDEMAFGDYSRGRWGWRFLDVRKLPEPIPARGALGLWKPEPDVAEKLLAFYGGTVPT